MANLTLARWRRWALNLGDNLEQPTAAQAYVEVRGGMTKLELEALDDKLRDVPETPEAAGPYMAKALEGLVRLGKEPLRVDGADIDSLEKLCALMVGEASMGLLIDVVGGVRYWNGVAGARESFSARLSGGASGTGPRPA